MATSLNFMLPLGALLDKSLARHLAWASPLAFIGGVGLRIAEDASLASVLGHGVVGRRGANVHAAMRRLRTERRAVQNSSITAGMTSGLFFSFRACR